MDSVTVVSGATFAREVTVYTDTSRTTPIDVTTKTLTFKVYDGPGGALVFTGSVYKSDPTHGKVVVSLSGTDTATKLASTLYGQVMYIDADDNTWPVDQIKLKIEEFS